jgi:hypothetical protein
MAHKVNFFDPNADFDEDGVLRPMSILETADWEAAKTAALAYATKTNNVFNVSVAPDPNLFEDLASYLEALNLMAHHLEAHPQEGCFMSVLTDDLSHWAEMGVTTPADLAAYLDACFEREMRKEAMG